MTGTPATPRALPHFAVLPTQLCNHPKLLMAASAAGEDITPPLLSLGAAAAAATAVAADAALSGAAAAAAAAMRDVLKGPGTSCAVDAVPASGKLAVLSALLESVFSTGGRAVSRVVARHN